ncbi:unnamed protein product [Boreogadus saida]
MIRPSLDPVDALFVGGCVGAYVQRGRFKARLGGCLTPGFHRTRYGNVTAAARLGRDFALLAFPPGALRQRNAALRASPPELTQVPEPCPVPEPYSFPRVPLFQIFQIFQTFQKGSALYLAFQRGPAF